MVITTDIARAGVDLRADIEHLPVVAKSVDLVVCNDVLEHVVDDSAALREIARVLAPGGTAIVHVPIAAQETVDYGFANPFEHHHRRAYGPDLVERMVEAGLAVTVATSHDVPRPDRRRYGLRDHDGLFLLKRGTTT